MARLFPNTMTFSYGAEMYLSFDYFSLKIFNKISPTHNSKNPLCVIYSGKLVLEFKKTMAFGFSIIFVTPSFVTQLNSVVLKDVFNALHILWSFVYKTSFKLRVLQQSCTS